MREVYLDNAATTQPYPAVVEVVCAAMGDGFGNASAQYERGRKAKKLLEESRRTLSEALDVSPEEVFFTSGGTESNNLAIRGAALRAARDGKTDVVVSTIEHPSVTKTVRALKREGWGVHYVGLKKGLLNVGTLENALDARTALVTCMTVQNEVGLLLPVGDVVAARDRLAPDALVHTDGVQAFGKLDFKPQEQGVDLASISAHKIGGPQGIGALYVKKDTRLFTTAFGGGQEKGLRSGTEAIPLIAGFAEAVRITFAHRAEGEQRAVGLKRDLLVGVLKLCPDARINSREDGSPFIVSFSLPGIDNDAALDYLDERGVYVSKASACETLHPDVPPEDWRAKHPMSLNLAGVPKHLIGSTFRISFSHQSTSEDVQRFLQVLADFLSRPS